MRRSWSLVLVLSVLAVLGFAANAAAERGWVFLGERTVTDALDHDVIPVTAAEGRFDALEVRVKAHAVQFRSMKIHFADGEVQEVELRQVIPAGGRSRVIDVAGHDRVIRSVEFTYDAQTRRGRRALVRLFGRH